MRTIRDIKNGQGSAGFKVLAPIKLNATLIDNRFENGNFSSHHRYGIVNHIEY